MGLRVWFLVWRRRCGERLLLVTGAALLGVSALRYWVVWVDGWDRPCELPLSLTLEGGQRQRREGQDGKTAVNNKVVTV